MRRGILLVAGTILMVTGIVTLITQSGDFHADAGQDFILAGILFILYEVTEGK